MNDDRKLEHHFLIMMSLIAFVSFFVFSFVNYFVLELHDFDIVSMLLSSLIYGAIYFYSRNMENIKKPFFVMVVITIPLFAVLTILNGGITGPMMYLFMLAIVFFFYMQKPKNIIYLVLYVFFTFGVIAYIEMEHPEIIVSYSSKEQQVVDTILTVMLVVGIFLYIVTYERKHYDRQRENALHAERVKASFLTNMSHEIRTPLNAIVGYAQLLADEECSFREGEDHMRVIRNNANILLNLVDDVLEMTRIESGTIELKNHEINLYELMQFLHQKFEDNTHLVSNPALKFVANYDEKAKDIVFYGDVIRIKQVLSNFLSNAFKFTETGVVILGYDLLKGNRIEFHVIDSGIGIPEKEKDFVFQKFKKQETGVEKYRLGAGLGLAIASNLTRLMKGTIELYSEQGEGTEVKLILSRDGVPMSD